MHAFIHFSTAANHTVYSKYLIAIHTILCILIFVLIHSCPFSLDARFMLDIHYNSCHSVQCDDSLFTSESIQV